MLAVPKWWAGIATKALAHKVDRFLPTPSDGMDGLGLDPSAAQGG